MKKIERLLYIESLKYSDWGTVFDINTRTGLANFYGLTKLKYCSIKNTTQTKDHCLSCLLNNPILNWSVPFKLKPLFTKSYTD